MYKEVVPISFEKVKKCCETVAKKLQDEEKPYKGIVAITRGGLFPAGLLAKKCSISLWLKPSALTVTIG